MLRAVDGAESDNFGNSIARSCNTIIVGAYHDNLLSGSVYTFTRQPAGGWVETSKIITMEVAWDDGF